MKPRSNVVSALTLLALVWLFLSPWVVRPFDFMYALNAWTVGTVTFVIVMSAVRPPRPAMAHVLAAMLGAWMFLTPWVLGYVDKVGPAWNSWIIGGAVAVLSLISAAVGFASGGGRPRRQMAA